MGKAPLRPGPFSHPRRPRTRCMRGSAPKISRPRGAARGGRGASETGGREVAGWTARGQSGAASAGRSGSIGAVEQRYGGVGREVGEGGRKGIAHPRAEGGVCLPWRSDRAAWRMRPVGGWGTGVVVLQPLLCARQCGGSKGRPSDGGGALGCYGGFVVRPDAFSCASGACTGHLVSRRGPIAGGGQGQRAPC
eukprot:scaffold10877_cov67-Isochrysis_galbana.AAC.1